MYRPHADMEDMARRWTCEMGGILLTEILLPRIARQRIVCLISTVGQARKVRIEKFELEKLESNNLSSMRASKRIISPSETW